MIGGIYIYTYIHISGAEMSTKVWGCQRNMINHAEPRLLNPLRASPAAHEKAWLSARLLSSMDTHLPERAFSLTHSAFILGVPSSRKRNFWGAPLPPLYLLPCILYPIEFLFLSYHVKQDKNQINRKCSLIFIIFMGYF